MTQNTSAWWISGLAMLVLGALCCWQAFNETIPFGVVWFGVGMLLVGSGVSIIAGTNDDGTRR